MKKTIAIVLAFVGTAFAVYTLKGEGATAASIAGSLFQWFTSVIGVASIVTQMTPSTRDDEALAFFKDLVDAIAFRFGDQSAAGK